MPGRLGGKIAIITGATKGIGEGIARGFAAAGAQVIVSGRDETRGAAIVDDIISRGGQASLVLCDLTNKSDIENLIAQTVTIYGGLTTLINNGAMTALAAGDNPVINFDDAALDKMIDTNIRGLMRTCRACLPHLLEGDGSSIINISSGLVLKGTPGLSTYTATKAASNSLTRSMAREYGDQGLRVNCVSPGLIESNEETQNMLDSPGARDAFLSMNALKNFGTVEDIANACIYLASDEAAYVTGATLCVDGGATA